MNKKQTKNILKLITFSILILLVVWLLDFVAKNPLFALQPFDNPVINTMLNYQLSALPVAGLAAVVTWLFARKALCGYLNLNRSGAMKSMTGKPSKGRWETDAWTLGLIMVAIIGVVAFLQVSSNGFAFHWLYVLLVIPFAASNALVEEVIFRLSFVSAGKSLTKSVWYGLIMGSLVFGFIHYWGVAPNGISGAVMSAFLGYFLAKSIQETNGFFWAFMIHFMLDVAILFFIFNLA